MKRIKKIVFFIIIIFLFIMICNKTVYGLSVSQFGGSRFEDPTATKMLNNLITAFSVIGSITSVVVLVVLGIKYMTGSVEEKATYKKTLLPYAIGCILIFAASSIAGIIYLAMP